MLFNILFVPTGQREKAIQGVAKRALECYREAPREARIAR
jgi:hypothetical protein